MFIEVFVTFPSNKHFNASLTDLYAESPEIIL